jgi:hypothetical protein
MKYLLTLLLCFFASNAFASSADSGKCPWKIPFTITIQGVGNQHSYGRSVTNFIEHDTDYGTHHSGDAFSIVVDTSSSDSSFSERFNLQYSLVRDSLLFSFNYLDTDIVTKGAHGFKSLLIIFAPGKDSIIQLTYFEADSFPYSGGISYGSRKVQISSLLFDDTSIFATDSSFYGHNLSMTNHTVDSSYSSWPSYSDRYTDFTASSVTLSGIFRPTTFSNPLAIVTESPQPNNLAIYSSNGSIACSFDVSDHARDLEIFSPLGIREASFTIPAGQTEASLPHLPAGFYFVRLDGAMAKVYISE